MKVNKETLQVMKQDMRTVINYYNIDVLKLDVNGLNNIWFHTFMNRTYTDDNINVKKDSTGSRILSFIDRGNYDLYPCGTNDTTMYTALGYILSELQKETSILV